MKKVYQQIIDSGNGDCMKCVIATLLGLNYDEVPHFLESENPNAAMADFMEEKGFEYEGVLYNYPGSEYSTISQLSECDGVNGLFYASVFSPKYYVEENGITGHQIGHAVLINKGFEIVFDPNPNYESIKQYPAAEELGYNGVKNVYIFSLKK